MRAARTLSMSDSASSCIRGRQEQRPWRRELQATVALPSGVRGPVERCAFRRLASIWDWVAIEVSLAAGKAADGFPRLCGRGRDERLGDDIPDSVVADGRAKTFRDGGMWRGGVEILVGTGGRVGGPSALMAPNAGSGGSFRQSNHADRSKARDLCYP